MQETSKAREPCLEVQHRWSFTVSAQEVEDAIWEDTLAMANKDTRAAGIPDPIYNIQGRLFLYTTFPVHHI